MDQSGRVQLSIRLCWAIAFIAIALGIWFRLSNMNSTPLWLDESYSAFAADHGLDFIWKIVPLYDVHPPFYYSILYFWDIVFGDTLLARRLLGLVCGLATIAVSAACGATLGNLVGEGRVGRALITTLTTMLVALQPMMVLMTQQVRPYPMMIMVYAIGTLAILKIASNRFTDRFHLRFWSISAFVAEACMLWLHSLGALYALSLSIALVIALLPKKPDRGEWLFVLVAQGVVGLLYVPVALMVRNQAPAWIHSTWLSFKPSEISSNLATIYLYPSIAVMMAGLIALLIGIAVLIRRKAGTVAATLLVLGLMPTILAILISSTLAPVFLPRTLSPSAIPILILIGCTLGVALRWRQIMIAFASVLVLPFAWADVQTMRLPPTEDWGATVAWLSAHVRPGDAVWAYPNDGALPLMYAMRDAHGNFPVTQIPADVPAIGYPGAHSDGGHATISLSDHQIDALMQTDAARRPPTIWLLGLASNGAMEKALDRTRMPIARFNRDEISVVGLARRDTLSTKPTSDAHRLSLSAR